MARSAGYGSSLRDQNVSFIDSFLAYDELDLIYFRIEYLSRMVSKTVIAESSLSHKGLFKPLYISDHMSKNFIEQFNVTFLNLDISSFSNGWGKEIASREILAEYLRQNFQSDFVILSDVDEIPSLEQLEFLHLNPGTYHFRSTTSYRRANWMLKDSHSHWNRGVVGVGSKLPSENGGRMLKLPIIDLPKHNGVHLSYLEFEKDTTLNKLPRVLNHGVAFPQEIISYLLPLSMRYQIDHLGRAREEGFGVFDILQFQSLPPILRHLYKKNTLLFDFEVKKNFLSRIFVSILLSAIVNNPKHLQFLQSKNKDTRFGFLFCFKVIPLFILELCQVGIRAIARIIKLKV